MLERAVGVVHMFSSVDGYHRGLVSAAGALEALATLAQRGEDGKATEIARGVLQLHAHHAPLINDDAASSGASALGGGVVPPKAGDGPAELARMLESLSDDQVEAMEAQLSSLSVEQMRMVGLPPDMDKEGLQAMIRAMARGRARK